MSISENPRFVVQAPFDDPSFADLVLRSADDVDFYVFKAIMAVASPVFRDMVSLSGPSAPNGIGQGDVTKDGLPVVVMHESSAPVLDTLLRILHPLPFPRLDDRNILAGIARAASKYDMSRAIEVLKDALLKSAVDVSSAVHSYMIACANGWEDVARRCACESLKYPIDNFDFDAFAMDDSGMSASHAWRLIVYRKKILNRILTDVLPEHAMDARTEALRLQARFLDECKRNCVCDNDRSLGSWVWLKWRSSMVVDLFAAPLGEDIVNLEGLLQITSRTTCTACRDRISAHAKPIVDAFRKEIQASPLKIELFG